MKKITLLLVFISILGFAQTPLHVFNFEGTMSNNANTATLVGLGANAAANTSFVADRNSRPNAALRCSGGATYYETAILNLPAGNSSRSISFWFKNDNANTNQQIISYGTAASNQAYGLELIFVSGQQGFNHYGFANDFPGLLTTTQGAWIFYTLVFNGTTASVYTNNVLRGSANKATWNTVLGQYLRIGQDVNNSSPTLNGVIDDLKIYNSALTTTQVTTVFNQREPGITNQVGGLMEASNATLTSFDLNYHVNSYRQATNVILKYGTSPGMLTTQVTLQTNLNDVVGNNYTSTISGLSANTVYYYTIEAINDSGKSLIPVRQYSTAGNFPALTDVVAYFPFENSLNSHDSSHQLTSINASNTPEYAAGKVGQGINFNQGINLANKGLVNSSSINTSLPGSEYTIAFWFDNSNNDFTGISFPTPIMAFSSVFVRQDQFNYAQIKRGYSSSASNFLGGTLDGPNVAVGLHHIALVHKAGTAADRVDCALYVDGLFVSTLSSAADVNTLYRYNTNFFVGGGADGAGTSQSSQRYAGLLDELYIFKKALVRGEILAVMNNTNQSLSNQDFNSKNLKFSLYPNPATNLINIELATELKSLEIYSLQGQKILASNKYQVDVSSLSKGMYLVRVEDVENGVSTQKLIVE